MSQKKKKRDTISDESYCQSIGKSIAEIIRYSLDEEFREQLFDMLGVSCSQETETEITNRLMAMIQNKTKSKSSSKVLNEHTPGKVTEVTGEKNSDRSDFSQSKTLNLSSSTAGECSLDSLIPSLNKRNWLQISSEKYAETIKRRKLGFHSQPLFSIEITKESPKINLESPSSSQSQEMTEVFDENMQYYKNKFRSLFENDGNKYLQKNLKLKKHFSQ